MTLEQYLEKHGLNPKDEPFRRITLAYCKTFNKTFDELDDKDTIRIMMTRDSWTVVGYNAKCGEIDITLDRDIRMDYRDRKVRHSYELRHGDRIIAKGNDFRTPYDWPVEKCMAEVVGWHDTEENDIFGYLDTEDGGNETKYVIEMQEVGA